jgi:hypothetical protein
VSVTGAPNGDCDADEDMVVVVGGRCLAALARRTCTSIAGWGTDRRPDSRHRTWRSATIGRKPVGRFTVGTPPASDVFALNVLNHLCFYVVTVARARVSWIECRSNRRGCCPESSFTGVRGATRELDGLLNPTFAGRN